MIDFLLDVFKEHEDDDAIIWNEHEYSYGWLLKRIKYWKNEIEKETNVRNKVIILEADFSPNAIALFLTLLDFNSILVPITKSVKNKRSEFIEIAQGEVLINIDEKDNVSIQDLPYTKSHELYKKLAQLNQPGLILFSSGSTGKSKAALHNMAGILEKFKVRKRKLRTITFLLYDHIGGVNTMLYTLSNGGCIITVLDRGPDSVLKAIEKYNVELLPTSPTFLNLILISEAYKRYDLSSLRTITYGTEPMPESTLKKVNQLYPNVKLQQTYGLSEIGILRSKSKDNHSLWVSLGGEGFETRIADGMLEVKGKSAMLGYLNAPSPFTNDGWIKTGDLVETEGEYIKILGRNSEIINVGGEKVFPQEVENVILELDEVAEVTVFGEKNPITGNIVCAKVTLNKILTKIETKKLIINYCKAKLQNFKIPVKIKVIDEKQHSNRFKKDRRI